jgi:hypothetical protein
MRLEWIPANATQPVVMPLLEVDAGVADAVIGGEPVRTPAFFKGQSSKPGWYWMASTGRLVSYESKFERDFLMGADFAGNVTAVLPQPLRLHFERQERPKSHVPDYLLALADGGRVLVDVKGARARSKPLNQVTFTLTQRACDALAWQFHVFTEPNPVYKQNLLFLAGYRNRRYTLLDVHLPVLATVVTDQDLPVTTVVDKVAAAADLPVGVAAAVLWRGVWTKVVTVPMGVPLNGATPVSLAVAGVL